MEQSRRTDPLMGDALLVQEYETYVQRRAETDQEGDDRYGSSLATRISRRANGNSIESWIEETKKRFLRRYPERYTSMFGQPEVADKPAEEYSEKPKVNLADNYDPGKLDELIDKKGSEEGVQALKKFRDIGIEAQKRREKWLKGGQKN